MGSDVVVQIHDPVDGHLCLAAGLECHVIQPFRFQDTIHSLRDGILIRISILGHADQDALFLQFGDILQAAVLTPPDPSGVSVLAESLPDIWREPCSTP